MKTRNKKGQLGVNLSGNILALIVAIVILVLGLIIVQETIDTRSVGVNTTSYDVGNESLVGLGDFPDFIPLIVIAVAASVIIGLILLGFSRYGFGER